MVSVPLIFVILSGLALVATLAKMWFQLVKSWNDYQASKPKDVQRFWYIGVVEKWTNNTGKITLTFKDGRRIQMPESHPFFIENGCSLIPGQIIRFYIGVPECIDYINQNHYN